MVWILLKVCEACGTCLHFLHICLSTHTEKEDLKVDISIQVGHPPVWQPGGTFFDWDLTKREPGSVWAAGGEGEAPSQWESGDLLSRSWGPIISHQSLSAAETWLQRALTPRLCGKETSAIGGCVAFFPHEKSETEPHLRRRLYKLITTACWVGCNITQVLQILYGSDTTCMVQTHGTDLDRHLYRQKDFHILYSTYLLFLEKSHKF